MATVAKKHNFMVFKTTSVQIFNLEWRWHNINFKLHCYVIENKFVCYEPPFQNLNSLLFKKYWHISIGMSDNLTIFHNKTISFLATAKNCDLVKVKVNVQDSFLKMKINSQFNVMSSSF